MRGWCRLPLGILRLTEGCVALERILTTDNLRRRGLIVVEWCIVCILFVWVFLG